MNDKKQLPRETLDGKTIDSEGKLSKGGLAVMLLAGVGLYNYFDDRYPAEFEQALIKDCQQEVRRSEKHLCYCALEKTQDLDLSISFDEETGKYVNGRAVSRAFARNLAYFQRRPRECKK